MLENNQILPTLQSLKHRVAELWQIFDLPNKIYRLEEVIRELASENIWNNPELAQKFGKERTSLENVVLPMQNLQDQIDDSIELVDLAIKEKDYEIFNNLKIEITDFVKIIDQLEFQRMFSGEMDACCAYLDIQSGSGGTEAQDWAEMLLRMYLRWCEKHNFKTTLIEKSNGDVAGIKSATIKVDGEFAFGWLRTETGVHRLVRKSPFDSGNRRHTSFAAIFVYPEVDDNITIDINPADLRIDTYRASGAGGQHINRTESAIRITHLPTNIVVQCQNDRSQHKNKSQAMKQLKAKLYEFELNKRNEIQQNTENNKAEIGWGSQIRSYVLDQSRVKDLRTKIETTNTQAVLDGDLDFFIEASLKIGLTNNEI